MIKTQDGYRILDLLGALGSQASAATLEKLASGGWAVHVGSSLWSAPTMLGALECWNGRAMADAADAKAAKPPIESRLADCEEHLQLLLGRIEKLEGVAAQKKAEGDAYDQGWKAGLGRGIENERKRCIGIVRRCCPYRVCADVITVVIKTGDA